MAEIKEVEYSPEEEKIKKEPDTGEDMGEEDAEDIRSDIRQGGSRSGNSVG